MYLCGQRCVSPARIDFIERLFTFGIIVRLGYIVDGPSVMQAFFKDLTVNLTASKPY